MIKEMSVIFTVLALILISACTQTVQLEKLQPPSNEVIKMELTSPEFKNNGKMPARYTCDGEDINPPLTIDDVPIEAQSLVLIVDDPNATEGVWDHWVVFNIPPETEEIPERADIGTAGENSWGKEAYGGPCPPSGEHRYKFKLYALDIKLDLQEGSTKEEVEEAMEGHILEETELIGKYQKK